MFHPPPSSLSFSPPFLPLPPPPLSHGRAAAHKRQLLYDRSMCLTRDNAIARYDEMRQNGSGTNMYTDTHTHARTYTHTHTHTQKHACTRTRTNIRCDNISKSYKSRSGTSPPLLLTHTRVLTHTYVSTRVCVYVRIYKRTQAADSQPLR